MLVLILLDTFLYFLVRRPFCLNGSASECRTKESKQWDFAEPVLCSSWASRSTCKWFYQSRTGVTRLSLPEHELLHKRALSEALQQQIHGGDSMLVLAPSVYIGLRKKKKIWKLNILPCPEMRAALHDSNSVKIVQPGTCQSAQKQYQQFLRSYHRRK